MKYNWFRKGWYGFIVGVMLLPGCNDYSESKKVPTHSNTSKLYKKPGSSFPDTLVIAESVAVLFRPDSAQLLRLKAETNARVFEGSLHEYFYQQRYARIALKKDWPSLQIREVDHYRFLLFVKKDKSRHLVDLDSIPDSFGLLVFNRMKSPLLVDMTNLETGISFYIK